MSVSLELRRLSKRSSFSNSDSKFAALNFFISFHRDLSFIHLTMIQNNKVGEMVIRDLFQDITRHRVIQGVNENIIYKRGFIKVHLHGSKVSYLCCCLGFGAEVLRIRYGCLFVSPTISRGSGLSWETKDDHLLKL